MMAIKVQCEQCSREFLAPDEKAGQQGDCPECGGPITVPKLAGDLGLTPLPTSPPPAPPPAARYDFSEPLVESLPEPPPEPELADYSLTPETVGLLPAAPSLSKAWRDDPTGTATKLILSHKLATAVGLLAVLVFIAYAVEGRWMLGFLLGGFGMAVTIAGFLPKPSKQQLSEPTNIEQAAGLICLITFALAVVGGIIGYGAGQSHAFSPEVGLTAMLALATICLLSLLGFVTWLFAKLSRTFGGFFYFAGWVYVFAFAIFPLVILRMLPPSLDEDLLAVVKSWNVGPAPLEQISLPAFPERGAPRALPADMQAGVEFHVVSLPVPANQPGSESELYVYVPAGEHAPHSLPCVLIAAAGSMLFSGMGLSAGDQAEHVPYAQAGFVVVAYGVDGELADDDSIPAFRRAYEQNRRAHAGLVNARNALEFALAKIPEVDPRQIVAAGHSSAGRLALLFAEREPRVAACVSYAGVADVAEFLQPNLDALRPHLDGLDEFVSDYSPRTGERQLNCPLFLFHARDDDTVSYDQTEGLYSRLSAAGKQVTLADTPSGGHYQPMLAEGIPQAITWLSALPGITPGTAGAAAVATSRPARPSPRVTVTAVDDLRPLTVSRTTWQAPVESPAAAEPLGDAPLPLRRTLGEILSVRFGSPQAGRVAVLSDPRRRFGAPTVGSDYQLSSFDLRDQRELATSQTPAASKLAAVDADVEQALLHDGRKLTVWSIHENRPLATWEFIGANDLEWGALIDDQHVATLDDRRRLVVWQLPGKPLYVYNQVLAAALSPGGKYLALFDGSGVPAQGHLIDALSGAMRGSMGYTGNDEPLVPERCLFRRDGTQLVAASRSKLAVWNLRNGQLLAEEKHSGGASGLAFLAGDFLACQGAIIAGGRGEVWRYGLSISGATWDTVTGQPDDRLWLAAAAKSVDGALLLPLRLPDAQAQAAIAGGPRATPLPGFTELNGAQLVAGHVASGAVDPPAVVGGGLNAIPPPLVAASASRKVAEDVLVDAIAGDPAELAGRLRWLPGAKSPSLGVRWGLSVSVINQEQQPRLNSLQDLANLTGVIGPGILNGLQQRQQAGNFGSWKTSPTPPAVLLPDVAVLPADRVPELIASAQERALDALVIIQLTPIRIGLSTKTDISLKVRLVDLTDRQESWSSASLGSNRLKIAGAAGQQMAAELVAQVLAIVDARYVLAPLPTIPAEAARRRAESIAVADAARPLDALVELRYYESLGHLTPQQAAPHYNALLGPEQGGRLATGNAAERQAAIRAWLESRE